MSSTRCSCQIVMKLELVRQVCEKYSNIKFNENPFSGNRVVPCGRTEKRRHDEAHGRFSQFCENAIDKTEPISVLFFRGTEKRQDPI